MKSLLQVSVRHLDNKLLILSSLLSKRNTLLNMSSVLSKCNTLLNMSSLLSKCLKFYTANVNNMGSNTVGIDHVMSMS